MVIIFDIDRKLEAEVIKKLIMTQNQELDMGVGESKINPIFKRGPRDGPTVWWVCEVEPSLYDRLIKLGRVYIGLMKCKVQEYFDVTQCFGCCKFGHKQADCRNQKVVCSFCGDLGHKKEVCNSKSKHPKCANCGEEHEATDRNCRARIAAISRVVVRTDYKINDE